MSIITKKGRYYYGNFVVFPSGLVFDGRTIAEYPARYWEKSDTIRRPRPKGVDILFSGTNVYSYKMDQQIGVYFERNNFPSGGYSEAMNPVPCPELGAAPWGLDIPDKYWANQLRSEIKNADINLAQAFAERKQTEKMFVDAGKRILTAYRSLRRGNVNGVFNALLGTGNRPRKGWKTTVRDTTGVASDHWLAFQYGVRPLISDLQGAVSEYWKVRAVSPVIRKFRVTGRNDSRSGGTVSGGSPYASYITTFNQRCKVVAWVTFVDDASAWDVSADRLGLTNPALLAWELIPFSFVADWFIGVGEFLEASGSFSNLGRLGIHVTTYNETVSSGAIGGGQSNRTTKTVSRSFKTVLPDPNIRIKSNPLSVSHVTSALALIRQTVFR